MRTGGGGRWKHWEQVRGFPIVQHNGWRHQCVFTCLSSYVCLIWPWAENQGCWGDPLIYIHLAKSPCLIWLNKVTHILVQGHCTEGCRPPSSSREPYSQRKPPEPCCTRIGGGGAGRRNSPLWWTLSRSRETQGVKRYKLLNRFCLTMNPIWTTVWPTASYFSPLSLCLLIC